jgi:hypothetical protein
MDCFAALAMTRKASGKSYDASCGGRWQGAATPSLRGALATKQSILSFLGEMDCRASLAMTRKLSRNARKTLPALDSALPLQNFDQEACANLLLPRQEVGERTGTGPALPPPTCRPAALEMAFQGMLDILLRPREESFIDLLYQEP